MRDGFVFKITHPEGYNDIVPSAKDNDDALCFYKLAKTAQLARQADAREHHHPLTLRVVWNHIDLREPLGCAG